MNKVILPICISILSANGLNAQIASCSGVDEMLEESQKSMVLNKENKIQVDKKALKACIEHFKKNQKVEFNPYPNYGDFVYDALNLLGSDYEYMNNYEKIKETPIEQMTIDNIKTMFTFIQRGERFCDGHIAFYIENGCLLKLLLRLDELAK